MPAKIFSATLLGFDAQVIDIEVDVNTGLPCTVIVGLADASIREAKERVRSCLRNSCEYKYPLGRVSINLAPADIYKYGTQCDLGIAVGILCASEQLRVDVSEIMFLGELSLDGKLRAINGALAMAAAAKSKGIKKIFLPNENIPEASLIDDLMLYGCDHIQDAIDYLKGAKHYAAHSTMIEFSKGDYPDFSEISGQKFAKRGLEIAASGMHNILMTGSPGAGKTMLARSLATILPEPQKGQLLEIIKIYGARGLISDGKCEALPFRNPHKTVSLQAFIGGGRIVKPGEITLAHNGILFMDEFPEFPRNIIESLREPLENGNVRISRTHGSVLLPASFIFVAAQNPCPCGFMFEKHKCICSAGEIQRYGRKISGPILDRIDLQIQVEKVDLKDMDNPEESSKNILARVDAARKIQHKRFGRNIFNSKMSRVEIKKFCILDQDSKKLIFAAEKKYGFSARAYFRILKVARTIADLERSEIISSEHIAESILFRTS